MSAPPNRFSSLMNEPVKKKQPESKPQSGSKPPSDPNGHKPHPQEPKPRLESNNFKSPPLEPKSNRFNFTEDELKPQKKEQRFTETSDRPNFRDRLQFERDRRAKDEADAAERKKIELERSLTDATSFPELVPQQKPTTQSVPTKDLNFLDKVKWLEEEKPIEWTDGLTILGSDEKEQPRKSRRPKTPYEIMSKQVELYETWKANYIAQYGEYYYEKYYRFPNYDYEYFDKLDEKYEAELEELERLEEEKERDQYIEYNTHHDYKNQYDD
jgi:hypothetical protein